MYFNLSVHVDADTNPVCIIGMLTHCLCHTNPLCISGMLTRCLCHTQTFKMWRASTLDDTTLRARIMALSRKIVKILEPQGPGCLQFSITKGGKIYLVDYFAGCMCVCLRMSICFCHASGVRGPT